jgi:S-adenosylhomocysteine hydrolase
MRFFAQAASIRHLKDGAFEGLTVGVSLPIEAKTADLTVALAEAGAEVRWRLMCLPWASL